MNPAALLARLASAPALAGENWFFLPEQASTKAADVDAIFNFINMVNLFFFVCMMGAMFFFVVAYRKRGDKHHKTSPNKGHHQLEIAWSVGPGLLLLVFFYAGFSTWMDNKVAPADAMEVRVTGQKWSWNFKYTDPESGGTFTMPDGKMIVPVHTPVKLVMSSVDVLHSFYVPAFRIKQDVVPNRYTTLWFEAIKEGEFQVFCAEYCGTDHSRMLSKVRVVSREDFDAWVRSEEAKAAEYGDLTDAQKGEKLFNDEFACKACHSVSGAKLVGPHLDGKFGTEETLDDGSTVLIDDNYVRESLMTPAVKIVAGFPPSMPPFAGRMSDEQVELLISYLKSIGAK